jgi:hypothetical protein
MKFKIFSSIALTIIGPTFPARPASQIRYPTKTALFQLPRLSIRIGLARSFPADRFSPKIPVQ